MSDTRLDLKIVALDRVYSAAPLATLEQWAAEGRLLPTDLVRPVGTSAWVPVADVPALAARLPSRPAPPPSPGTPPPLQAAALPAAARPAIPPARPTAVPRPAASVPARPATPAPRPALPAAWSAGVALATDHDLEELEDVKPRPRSAPEDSDMDMTPMIDVTFQLLIFFMFSNGLANPNPIPVPEAVHGQGMTPEGKQMILIDAEGRYYLGESTKAAPLPLDDLLQVVADNAGAQPQPLDVIINAAKTARHRQVQALIVGLGKLDDGELGKVVFGIEEKRR